MKHAAHIRKILMLVALFAAGCVTVNIYFPAAKVEKAAEQIVDDVYGKQQETPEAKPESEQEQRSSVFSLLASAFGPAEAWAQDAASISNAAIRGLKQEIAENHKQLLPYYQTGNIGITNQGFLEIRSTEGLALQDTAKLKRLTAADNQAREKLYKEVAAAMNIDPSQIGKVQSVFADQWRGKAGAGWWIQQNDGSWVQK